MLSSLIGGHLGGLFDGPSTVRFDPAAPMIALGSAALGEDDLLQSLVMLCASAWVGSTMADPRYGQRLFVYDEAWRIISGEAQLDRMNADLRLSRYYGIANIIAMHALSDPDKIGHADSAAVKKARGLLSLCDTRVVFRQAPGELDRATHDLALTAAEREVVAGAGVGRGPVEAAHQILPGPDRAVRPGEGHVRHRPPDDHQLLRVPGFCGRICRNRRVVGRGHAIGCHGFREPASAVFPGRGA